MRLGMMAVCVLLPAGLAAQTTYSSPVRITNTPVPVNGDVKVTGNVPVVNPAGVPMQVKAWDTIPVAQQGAVTVTPSGGTMVVTPNGGSMVVAPQGGSMPVAVMGTAAVSVSGTPTVGISTGANTVKMGTPAVFSRYALLNIIPAGEVSGEGAIGVALPSGEMIEIESISGSCLAQTGAKVQVMLYAVPQGGSTRRLHPVPVQYQGPDWLQTSDIFYFNQLVKIYAKPETALELRVARHLNSGTAAQCSVSVYGKVY